ncbi:MAG: transporter substrate-binding domain-containing protein [Rhodospirillaceae bacterium]|nr:transporter substrate-binding domain-containing protein [Rhodospirillaceae bacterium]
MRRHRPAAPWLALAALAVAAAPAQAEDLRLGTEGAYPPYNYIDASGELQGFDIAFGNTLCERMGVTCEWVAQDWDGIIPALLNGRYDAIVAAMSRTDERRAQIAFSNAYTDTPVWLVGRADEFAGVESFEDAVAALQGKTVGVQTATIFQDFVEQQLGDSVELRLYDTQDNLGLDLGAGRLDAGVADSLAWEAFLDSEGGQGFARFGPSLTGQDFPELGEGFGIGLRQEDTDLLARINAAICGMIADGTLEALHQEYLGFYSPIACEQ